MFGGLERYVRGRWRLESPVVSCEKRADGEEVCEREVVRRASRILVSSFFAIISAALPRGERINGTCPVIEAISSG